MNDKKEITKIYRVFSVKIGHVLVECAVSLELYKLSFFATHLGNMF